VFSQVSLGEDISRLFHFYFSVFCHFFFFLVVFFFIYVMLLSSLSKTVTVVYISLACLKG
jgi:uncharacterized membrane protein YgaE (UPF0421/DUF939 family)